MDGEKKHLIDNEVKEKGEEAGLENLGRLSVALTTERFEILNLTEHFGVNGLWESKVGCETLK